MTIYLIVANVVAFLMCWYDKHCAIHHKRRIPERTLFFAAFIGGAFGMYLAMLLFRHKTRHWYFAVGMPVLCGLQIVLIALIKYRLF